MHADFVVADDTINLATGELAVFTDASVGAINRYQWTFGDSDSSTVASPMHSYALPGLYTVELTVWNDDCIDVTTQTVLVINTTGIEAPTAANGMNIFTLNDEVVIDFDWAERSDVLLSVYDAGGRLVHRADWQSVGSEQKRFSSRSFETGIYTIRLSYNGEEYTQKVVIR